MLILIEFNEFCGYFTGIFSYFYPCYCHFFIQFCKNSIAFFEKVWFNNVIAIWRSPLNINFKRGYNMVHATLYVYTDVNKTNGNIDVFAHLLTTSDDNRYTDVDYGRHTYVGYSRWEAVNLYITKVVGTSIKDSYNINIKTF